MSFVRLGIVRSSFTNFRHLSRTVKSVAWKVFHWRWIIGIYLQLAYFRTIPCSQLSIASGTLDLDSASIQLDVLGHTLTPFLSVLSCFSSWRVLPFANLSWLLFFGFFFLNWPGTVLYPGPSQFSACWGMCQWYIQVNEVFLLWACMSPFSPSSNHIR